VLRRKPRSARKDSQIKIRLTESQKQTLVRAADRAGLELSSWLRAVGLQAAAEKPTGKK
jgi:uncharacterized protein (DUF1778 family)